MRDKNFSKISLNNKYSNHLDEVGKFIFLQHNDQTSDQNAYQLKNKSWKNNHSMHDILCYIFHFIILETELNTINEDIGRYFNFKNFIYPHISPT